MDEAMSKLAWKLVAVVLDAGLANAGTRGLERLDRGLVASRTTSGVFLSWRILGTDPPGTSFNLHRDGLKIATTSGTAP